MSDHTTTTSRADHLQWCKDRALLYVDEGDIVGAFASLTSDLNKHEGTQGHAASELGMMLMLNGNLTTPAEMRDFINGCN